MPGSTMVQSTPLETTLGCLSPDLSVLVRALVNAGVTIARALSSRNPALNKYNSHRNSSGDQVLQIDEFAHQTVLTRLKETGLVCVMASEEAENPIEVSALSQAGEYVVVFDPLDGSANARFNVCTGTIFAIYQRTTPVGQKAGLAECLQPGRACIAAGYMLYGPATMMVLATGGDVHGYTFIREYNEYFLTDPRLRIPPRGQIYSANESYWRHFDKPTRALLEQLTAANYTNRWIGSLVADFHRTLYSGGIFLYPAAPKAKLRLCYEAAPLAFILEAAGGRAITGSLDVLDLVPSSLHQRIPLIFGGLEEIAHYERCLLNHY